MWLFTKYGFFSVVCARQGNGSHGMPVDPDRMMVRARVAEHLAVLKERFPDELGGSEIVTTAHTDYACRMFVAKPTWVRVAAALAEETDYDNFKSAVAPFARNRRERISTFASRCLGCDAQTTKMNVA